MRSLGKMISLNRVVAVGILAGSTLTGMWAGIFLAPLQAREKAAPTLMPTPAPTVMENPQLLPGLVFEQRARRDIPTLQDMTVGAKDDAVALSQIVSYFEAKKDHLKQLWNVQNETRLRALFAMYVIHISHSYGVVTWPAESLLDYIRYQTYSECGSQSLWQGVISTALGLSWRNVAFEDGAHGWIEVLVDGQWEVFDSTSNLWLSKPAEVLLEGVARTYKAMYTPILDADYPDAYAHYARYNGSYNVLALRQNMIGLGITWKPAAKLVALEVHPEYTESSE